MSDENDLDVADETGETGATEQASAQTAAPKPAGKAPPRPPARRTVKATAESPGENEYDCSIPKDRSIPPLRVRGQTAADARERYLSASGIIKTEHTVQAVPVE